MDSPKLTIKAGNASIGCSEYNMLDIDVALNAIKALLFEKDCGTNGYWHCY